MAKISGLIALTFLVAGQAVGQDAATKGRETYMRYCATCHGLEARGNGPMAPVLILQPTDLTQLAANNGGVFPTVRVVMRIDGRQPLVSHGSPMPIYGEFFEGSEAFLKAQDGMPILTSQPVVDLVAWIESVQK